MSDIKDRFKMIMEREKLTAVAFAESIGVAQATISHILGSRNKYPSMEVILKLHKRYSDINLEWLLTGTGNMSNLPDKLSNNNLEYPLFSGHAETQHANIRNEIGNRREIKKENLHDKPGGAVNKEVIYEKRPVRKIVEIRIFFDDNTYEIFRPENKE